MTAIRSAPYLLVLLTLLSLGKRVNAQYSPAELRQEIERADRLAASTENQKAIQLADSLTAVLTAAGELDTPLGLDLLLASATAHGNSNRDSTAMSMLLHVREESHRRELWATHASADLALAHLYQKMGRRKSSEEALENAKLYIDNHALDALYPVYALRKSYWIRSFSKDRDLAIHYAEEALRTAPRFRDSVTLASGHMLMGFLTDLWPETSIAHFERGIALCREIGDYVGTSYMFSGLATRMTAQERYRKALVYNDSSILAARRALGAGQESDKALPDALQARGEIYYGLGKLDSAYYFMHEGHDLEIDNLKEIQHQKALEVDARYNDQLKAARIAEQARLLRDESKRVNLLLLVIGLALLLGAVLAYTTARFRKLNRKNLAQAEELRSLDVVKTRFFANVSHELRTPLTLIQGPVQSLRADKNLTDSQRELLQLASNNGDKLQELIGQILELHKLESGQHDLNPRPTPLQPFVEQCLGHFSALALQKQITYRYEIDVAGGVKVTVDREKCRIILANLLSNAFKFTAPGGEITVKVLYRTPNFLMEVSDTGSGISAEELPYIFNRFYQTKRTDRPAEGGTGIGLALCKEYVELNGGSIHADSEEGKGTTFYIRMPLEETDEQTDFLQAPTYLDDQATAVVAEVPESQTETALEPLILVVEDNYDLQEYLRLILGEDYRVETADNGQQALDRLPGMPECRLILSDIMMPVMDGYQLLERVKSTQATAHLPFVMLTARGDAGDRLRALRIGVDDYLTKPFEAEELLASIANLLRNQEVRTTTEAELIASGEAAPSISEADREWLESFESFVQEHQDDPALTVPHLASQFTMSESTLLRQVKRLTGLTTLQYIQDVRLTEARRMLQSGDYTSISQLASDVGYRDARSFSRAFRKRFGVLPSEYAGAAH